MDRDCEVTQELLVEVTGEVARLDEATSRHLGTCEECRRVAESEARLGHLIEWAVPPADAALVARIVSASEAARRRRRVLAFAPVAVSAVIGASGAVLLGGVPGFSLLGALPAWSSQGWLSLAAACRDAATVVGALARTAPTVVPAIAIVGAGILALGGAVLAIVSARRWGAAATWSGRG